MPGGSAEVLADGRAAWELIPLDDGAFEAAWGWASLHSSCSVSSKGIVCPSGTAEQNKNAASGGRFALRNRASGTLLGTSQCLRVPDINRVPPPRLTDLQPSLLDASMSTLPLTDVNRPNLATFNDLNATLTNVSYFSYR